MDNKPIYSSDELIQRAIAIANADRPKTVAVAAAQDVDVLGAVSQAQADGFLEAALIGDEIKINTLAEEHKIDISHLTVVNEPNTSKAAHAAAAMASEKKADAIMKGFLPTSALLKTVLDKQHNLREENTLSHCAVLDIPGYHKLLNFTDGGMLVKPTVEQKFQVLENAVLVGRAMGLSPVKVALSAAVDQPSDSIPHTLSDVNELIPMAQERLQDVVLQGPLPLELACVKTVAEEYSHTGPVVGEADIYLVDSIEEGNIVAKSLIQFADAVFAGVIVGTRVPVSLVSRTDTVKNKKASLALACVIADYYTRNKIWEK